MASILTPVYHILKAGTGHDLGINYFDRRPPKLKAKRLVPQFANFGFLGATSTCCCQTGVMP
jgi:hypothetical protein